MSQYQIVNPDGTTGKHWYHTFTTDTTAGSADSSGNYTADVGNGTVFVPSNTTWYNTGGNITIDYDLPSVQFPINEEAEVYILPDMVCAHCMKPLGMFCSDGHYIQSDNEEYRFVHSLKCNEKLGLKYKVAHVQGVNKAYHVKCPE